MTYFINPLTLSRAHLRVIRMLCDIHDRSRRGIYKKNLQWQVADQLELAQEVVNNNISNDFYNKAVEMVNDVEHQYYVSANCMIVTTVWDERIIVSANDYCDERRVYKNNKLNVLSNVPESYKRYLDKQNIPQMKADELYTECNEIINILIINECKRNHNFPIKFVHPSFNGERVIDYILDVYLNRFYTQPFTRQYIVKICREANIKLGKKYEEKDASDICSLMVLMSDDFLKF